MFAGPAAADGSKPGFARIGREDDGFQLRSGEEEIALDIDVADAAQDDLQGVARLVQLGEARLYEVGIVQRKNLSRQGTHGDLPARDGVDGVADALGV